MQVSKETSFIEQIRYAIVRNTIISWEEKRKDKGMKRGSYHFTDITENCFIKNQVTLNATRPLKVMRCALKPVSDVKPIPSQGFKL